MKKLNEVEAEANASRKLLSELKDLAEVENHVLAGEFYLVVGSFNHIDSTDGLQHVAVAYVNKKKAEFREQGIDVGHDLGYADVNYCGESETKPATISFPSHTIPGVVGATSVTRAANGSWQLDKKGTLTLSHAKAHSHFAVVGGQVYWDKAEFDKAFSPLTTSTIPPGELAENISTVARVIMKAASDGRSYAAGIHLGDLTKEEIHWNKPEDLPPVGCPLLIKAPAGTKTLHVDSDRVKLWTELDKEEVLRAFRTGHLADRSGQMEYRLPDNSTVTGRFPWTYP